jgi:hypothetical protein
MAVIVFDAGVAPELTVMPRSGQGETVLVTDVLEELSYAENAVPSHGHLQPGMLVMTKPFAMEMLASRINAIVAGT